MDNDLFYVNDNNKVDNDEQEINKNDEFYDDFYDDNEIVDDEEENNEYFNDDFISNFQYDFTSSVIERGEEYYNNGKVLKVLKNGTEYLAKVLGSNNETYNVNINISDDDIAYYRCDCPCEFNCKHEYAVLLAISNREYIEVELKEKIHEKNIGIKELINLIPADEIKNYLLKNNEMMIGNALIKFKDDFFKYLPHQDYDYYYNNLYNDLTIGNDVSFVLNGYFDIIRKYLTNSDFMEAFLIVKAIIEAYHDTNSINLDKFFFDLMQNVSVFLRIIYRNISADKKGIIDEWKDNVLKNNGYQNYYLEDIILTLK